MKASEIHDTLTVTKGPEDGSEYALTATPVYIGTGPTCVVQLQFDNTVRPIHARMTAARGGYRIRSAEGAPVHVDGRRAGTIRSRTIRPGGIVKVGYTEFMLGCAKDGMSASQSGSWTDSDPVWAIRSLGSRVPVLTGLLRALLFRLLKLAAQHWFVSLTALFLALYYFIPPFREFVGSGFDSIREVLEL